MCTKVILHVATALHGICTNMAFEFLEDLVVALAHYVGKNVQTSTVWHAENCGFQSFVGCCRKNFVNDRNH